jgi:dimeric dUTPase (all-alpha-NTP-PPase superfamily)
MDMLEEIFNMQREYLKILSLKRDEFIAYSKEERISMLCTAIIHEACELQGLTGWKWWKSKHEFDTSKAKEELIDILHFVIQIALELDMSAKDLLDEYRRKNIINRDRQINGY